jgi:hypothetical protein
MALLGHSHSPPGTAYGIVSVQKKETFSLTSDLTVKNFPGSYPDITLFQSCFSQKILDAALVRCGLAQSTRLFDFGILLHAILPALEACMDRVSNWL